MMINSVYIEGKIKDLRVEKLPSQQKVVKFTVVQEKKLKQGKKDIHRFEVEAFGKLAKAICDRLKDGISIVVIGELREQKWIKEGKKVSKVKIVASKVYTAEKVKEDKR